MGGHFEELVAVTACGAPQRRNKRPRRTDPRCALRPRALRPPSLGLGRGQAARQAGSWPACSAPLSCVCATRPFARWANAPDPASVAGKDGASKGHPSTSAFPPANLLPRVDNAHGARTRCEPKPSAADPCKCQHFSAMLRCADSAWRDGGWRVHSRSHSLMEAPLSCEATSPPAWAFPMRDLW